MLGELAAQEATHMQSYVFREYFAIADLSDLFDAYSPYAARMRAVCGGGCNAVPPGVRLHCAGLEHDLTVAHATLSTTSRLLTPHQQRHRHSCRSQRPLEGTTVNEINGVNKPSSTESVISQRASRR